ncbi:TetR/AcrR family transcriptional regulator [Micromonospora chersina]|uniref:Transcriptional regulator, TetR family n=1 Tax=Micromonospora chersina TaxID=47854 RepID=A0A1C6V9Y7_9ACTN|nr:TetR/AcrR family transcriptional regulator [Micromonospora chersina]SCL63085.1 transcriptional regulator, TetR family [Micromonospora chersina]
MAIRERRERERAERERAIVAAARDLAEAEGWDAVTTRRLAAEIEYSQPVLYSHFKGKGAIMAAVAVEGCGDLAAELAAARAAATDEREAVAGIATAYADFAERRPALYDAIFNLPTELPFASQDVPVELARAFAELAETLRPFAGDDNLETFTETFWSGLHGLVSLMRNGRLRREEHERRLALLVDRFARLG